MDRWEKTSVVFSVSAFHSSHHFTFRVDALFSVNIVIFCWTRVERGGCVCIWVLLYFWSVILRVMEEAIPRCLRVNTFQPDFGQDLGRYFHTPLTQVPRFIFPSR